MNSTADTAEIPLRKRDGDIIGYALVDAADFEWLNSYRWHAHSDKAMYVSTYISKGVYAFMHRMILGLDVGDPRIVDHVNRNPRDNRRFNLRISTHAKNSQNRSSRLGVSQYRCVTRVNRKKPWRASIKVDGNWTWLGSYMTELEAAQAVAAFCRENLPHSVLDHHPEWPEISVYHVNKAISHSGENNGRAKLTSQQIEEIRSAYASESITQTELSCIYEVSQGTICSIVNGHTWKS